MVDWDCEFFAVREYKSNACICDEAWERLLE
jgi:hypothetical protein